MRRAFTLVELLVVITIIGVIVALMIPAIRAVRASYKTPALTAEEVPGTPQAASKAKVTELETGMWSTNYYILEVDGEEYIVARGTECVAICPKTKPTEAPAPR